MGVRMFIEKRGVGLESQKKKLLLALPPTGAKMAEQRKWQARARRCVQ